METLDPTAGFKVFDDFLNFCLDDGDENQVKATKDAFSYSMEPSNRINQDHPDDHSPSFYEFAEEELEWLSDKDAFPAVEPCFDILSDNHGVIPDHMSPVSVPKNNITGSSSGNGNSSMTMSCCGSLRVLVHYPVRARSKHRQRRRRGFPDFPAQQYWRWNPRNGRKTKHEPLLPPRTTACASVGRRCLHCQAEKTPQWRAGPMGPKTLCNACGVRYKSGRLVPEYRPASSPTFSTALHSNSHRKIMEMRRQKQLAVSGMGMDRAYG